MQMKELKYKVDETISNLMNHGVFPKENNIFDYKSELNLYGITDPIEIFLRNFCKDILAFANGDGGIIILGIKENKSSGALDDVGLNQANVELLEKIDINNVSQKFEKIAKVGIGIDLQHFQLGTRRFYYLLIEKQNQVLIPVADHTEYKISKGEVIYRGSSKNEIANNSTQDFNRFLQKKANEQSREFMEIWSKLMPEIFDINPREILILNPKSNKVYGFNGKDNVLSSSEVEIENSESGGIFNIILNAISAGEIGKITNNEGKPIYKIVGEISSKTHKPSISLSTLQQEINRTSRFKFTNAQLKLLIFKLGWVNVENFKIDKPLDDTINSKFNELLWIDTFDEIKASRKIVFSKESISILSNEINDESKHIEYFNKKLEKNKKGP